jgi:hypothetical protein
LTVCQKCLYLTYETKVGLKHNHVYIMQVTFISSLGGASLKNNVSLLFKKMILSLYKRSVYFTFNSYTCHCKLLTHNLFTVTFSPSGARGYQQCGQYHLQTLQLSFHHRYKNSQSR